MGHLPHLSRRQILASIPTLISGSALLPLSGQSRDQSGKSHAIIRGALRDGATGKPVAAKLRVTADGQYFLPVHAIQTMPPSKQPYFYARGSYEIAVPPGRYEVEAVRGISHKAAVANVEAGPGIVRTLDFDIPVLQDLHAAGWYSGNTHTHYHLELEENPDDRLRLVPPAEGLDISVISYLIRGDSAYITNRYPIGRLPQFSGNGTLIDMGEEARNNKTDWAMGYGHCLFLNIPRLVEPASTGLLAPGGKAPDFPTLGMLCEQAKKIGGTTIWCHNGNGMELPVAVALGGIDAFNVADGSDAEYKRYYNLLGCGFRLPLSTGTDWWIYDHNRVFVQVDGSFTYEGWLAGLRAGRTFVSNGPLLEFSVNGKGPGATLDPAEPLRVKARAVSRLPFERIEIVRDGEVIAEQAAVEMREVVLEREIPVTHGGWIAARIAGRTKTHAGFTVFAHSSPVYYRVANTPSRRAEAAGTFIDELEESVRFIRKNYRFASDADRAVALGRFEQARLYYAKVALASA
jgi:hypothetical protein